SVGTPSPGKSGSARAPDANEQEAFDATAASIVGKLRQSARSAEDPLRLRTFPAIRLFGVTLSKSELETIAQDARVEKVEAVRLAVAADIATLKDDPHALREFDRLKFTGKGQTIVIIDTGFNLEIPSIRKIVKDGSCISKNDPRLGIRSACPNGGEREMGLASLKACTVEGCDHGTSVASLAAGVHKIGRKKVVGAAPDAKIYALSIASLKCIKKSSKGKCKKEELYMDSETVINALYHMTNWGRFSKAHENVAAVNMSLAVGIEDGTHSKGCEIGQSFASYPYKIKSAIDSYREYFKPGLFIAAAGNNGGFFSETMNVPACLSNAISVGNVKKNFRFVENSGWGDYVAVGRNVSVVTANGVKTVTGTSFAAPQVAGFAARSLEAYKKGRREQFFGIGFTWVQTRKRKPSDVEWSGAYQAVPRADATLASAMGEPFAVPDYINRMDTDGDGNGRYRLIQCHYNVCLGGPDSKKDVCYMNYATNTSLDSRTEFEGARRGSVEISSEPPIFSPFVLTTRYGKVDYDKNLDKIFNRGLVRSLGVGFSPIKLKYRELSSYRKKEFDFKYDIWINDLSYTCDP
ncbi:MAG TPA: S8/S53 family peptidase, partial [Hyphomicrobium sp.]|nr:S8/S53 family peptidase [Hyphomicrobium sp.]